jgi:hypothetical protein
MKNLNWLRTIALVAFVASISGCMMLKGSASSEDAMKDNYFTYIGQNPYSPTSTDAIVLGKLTINGGGTVFSIVKLDANNKPENEPVTLDLSYLMTKSRGILPKKKKVYHVKTVDVYAGNAPYGRTDAIKPYTSAGSLIKSIYGGSTGDLALNIKAMQTQIPSGWFLVRLPQGNYQIVKAVQEGNSVGATVITTTTNSVSEGPTFQVSSGVINYIGNYNYSPNVKFSSDLDEAKRALSQGTRRLSIIDPQWVIKEAF